MRDKFDEARGGGGEEIGESDGVVGVGCSLDLGSPSAIISATS